VDKSTSLDQSTTFSQTSPLAIYHLTVNGKIGKNISFKCAVPQPPYQEKFGDKIVLTFDYVVICLWELDGNPIVKNHIMSLYVFLPAMKDPKPDLLKQAIREIRQHYSPRNDRGLT
jgi:hypothetical protein